MSTMLPTVTEYAYAKLNLSLDVTARRDDGYHDMLMVMQTVSLADRIVLERIPNPGLHLSCNYRYVPTDERNLAARAARAYLKAIGAEAESGLPVSETADRSGIAIRLDKRIPVGAGMAGGSADAAAVLRGMNRMFGRPLGRQELEALAEQVGSDVAFCIAGGTQLASGRGEVLQNLPPLPACHLVVCKPGFSISTPELFRKQDEVSLRRHPDTAGMLDALDRGDLREVAIRLYNVFEEIPDRRMRQIAEIKSRLLDHGALGAVMTGTGSAVFALFRDADAAAACAGALSVINRLDDAFLAQVSEKSRYIFSALEHAQGVKAVTGKGLMIGIQTEKNAKDIVSACMEKGVLCLTAKDKVRLLPALNIPMDVLETAIAIIKEACK